MDLDTGKVKSSSVTEAMPPTRVHTKIGEPDEMIVVRNVGTFQKQKDGTWLKSMVDTPGMLLSFFSPNAGRHFKEKVKNCKKLRSETYNGQPADVWEYDMSMFAVSSTTQAWISGGLIRKLDIHGKVMGTHNRSIQTIEYGPKIRIEPPAKFREEQWHEVPKGN